MLNKYQKQAVELWLDEHSIPKQDWDFIFTSLGYDLWEVKGQESYSEQRKQLKVIVNKTNSLLSAINKISWELSEELHQELDMLLDEDEESGFDFRREFEKGLDENFDKEELLYLHDQEVDDWYKKVPINGRGNVFNYLGKLKESSNKLLKTKTNSRDNELYPLLVRSCEQIGEKYAVTLSQESIMLFICACTSKDREAVKQQWRRLNVMTSKRVDAQLKEVGSLESKITDQYKQQWKDIFDHKLKSDGGVTRFWIHWELVELCNESQWKDSYTSFLQSVLEKGVGDILKKYGLNCPLPD